MIVLGIDTATRDASVAILHDNELIAQRQFTEKRELRPAGSRRTEHSEILIPLINAALKDAEIALTQVGGVAVSIGPGSFTGVRIALSTAKGMAYGCAIPIVGISTLHACAATNHDAELVCPVLDARKAEVYMALFARRNGEQTRLTDDLLLPVENVAEELAPYITDSRCVLIGGGAEVYGTRISSAFGDRVQVRAELTDCLAAAVARLGSARIAAGSADDLARLTPVYGRVPQAEVSRQEAHNLSN